MPDERIVYWRALADFSKVRSESAKTQASIKELNDEVTELNASNAKLGTSEDNLAQKTNRAGSTISAASQKVAEAREAETKATLANTRATNSDTLAAAKSNVETARTAKARQAEVKAANDVEAATQRVKNAREEEAQAALKTKSAEDSLQRSLESNDTTSRQIVAAEKILAAARDNETRATNKVRVANGQLAASRQREASVLAENAYAEAKSADAYAQAEAKKAKAVEDASAREVAASERQDRMDARAVAAHEARAEAAAQRDARREAQAAARDDEYARKSDARTKKLLSEYAKIAAAEKAAKSVVQRESPDRENMPLQQRVQSIQSVISDKDESSFTNAQAAAVSALTRAEGQLKAARDAEEATYTRINNAEEKLAVARSDAAHAAGVADSAEEDLDHVRADASAGTRTIADAENRVAAARLDAAKADSVLRDAENSVARARNDVTDVTSRAERAESRLTSTTRDAERAFIGGGGGGNIFSTAMSNLFGWFEKADEGASQLGGSLGSIMWPAIAGGVYLLAEALSTLVSGLFALGSAVAPAVGGLAAILPTVYALGGALLSVKAAFSGVTGVLKAYQSQQTSAAAGSTKAANTEANNADTVKNAQQSLADARAQVAITYQQGQEQVTQASQAIVQANQNELDATTALSQARIQARQNIIDLKNATIDAALAARGATLDLADAQASLQQVLDDPNSTRADRERAQLAVDQASQSNVEAGEKATSAQQDSANADAAGVEGDSSVISAKRQLTQATQAVTQAEQQYRDTLASASQSNAKAMQAVTTASEALGKAERTNTADMLTASGATDTYAQKLAQLPLAAQKFVEKLISMQNYWKSLRATAAENLFPGLTLALDQLPKLFPVIRSGVASISRTVGHLGDQFANMITTSRWIDAFKKLNAASTPILNSIGHAIMNIVDMLRAVATAAIPMTEKLAKGFRSWTKGIDDAANAAQKNGNLGRFFNHSYQVLHQIGQILKNIGSGFFNMGKSASKSGQSMLSSIDNLTKKWAEWTGSVSGRNELSKFFDTVRQNMQFIDHIVGEVTGAFLRMGGNKNFQPIVQGLQDIWNAVKQAFGGNGGQISQEFVKLLHIIATSIREVSQNSDGLHVFLGTLNLMLTLLNALLRLPGVGPALGVIAAGFAAFKALKLFGVISAIEKLNDVVGKFVGKSKDVKQAAKNTVGALEETEEAAQGGVGSAGVAEGAGVAGVGASKSRKISAPAILGRFKKFGRAGQAGGEVAEAAPEVGEVGEAAGAAAPEVSGLASVLPALANPVGIAIAAIVALVGTLVILYAKVKSVHDFINKMFFDIGKVIKAVWNAVLKPVFLFFVASMKDLGRALEKMYDAFKPIIKIFDSLLQTLKPLEPILKYIGIALAVAFGVLVLGPIITVIAAITAVVAVLAVLARALAWVINNVTVPLFKIFVAIIVDAVNVTIAVFKLLATIIDDVWKDIVATFRMQVAVVLAVMNAMWIATKTVWNAIKDAIMLPINFVWNWLKSVWTDALNWLKTTFGIVRSATSDAWNDISNAITTPISVAWSVLKSIWNGITSWLSGEFSALYKTTVGWFEQIGSAISSPFDAAVSAIESAFDSIKGTLTSAINFVSQKILNPLINAVNTVIHAFGGTKIDSIPSIGGSKTVTGSAAGGGGDPTRGTHGGTFAQGGVLPGYTPGRDPHEFVSNTGMRVSLSGGEGILTPEATRMLGGRVGIDAINGSASSRLRDKPRFKSAMRAAGNSSAYALGGLISNPFPAIGSGLKSVGGDLLGGVKDVGGAISGVIQKLRDAGAWATKKTLQAAESPLTALLSQIPVPLLRKLSTGIFNTVNDAAYNFVAGNGKSSGGDGSAGASYIPSGQHASLIKQALTLNNVADTSANEADVNYIVTHESSWNSNAQNNTDINAKNGIPSQGLTQLIPPNFEAYRVAGTVDSIRDPLANLAAGVHYMKERYGSVANAQNYWAGHHYYRDGGMVQKFHEGGVVPRMNRGTGATPALSAVLAQAGVDFPGGPSRWNDGLTRAYKARLSGVDVAHDVSFTNFLPTTESTFAGDSALSQGLMHWTDRVAPKTYDQLWKQEPYGKDTSLQNSSGRNPLTAILSYVGNSKMWEQFRSGTTTVGKAGSNLIANVQNWLRGTADKKPYQFGAVGPDSYDCSGLTGEVWARLTGHPSYHRYFSTMDEGQKKFFSPGAGDGQYVVGYTHRNGGEQHTAGDLGGLKFEARDTQQGILVGSQAASPNSFDHVMHLAANQFVDKNGQSVYTKKESIQSQTKDAQWKRSLRVVSDATNLERSRVGNLRNVLGLSGAGNNQGLFSDDMSMPLDHAAAHALGIAHPADWDHPWSGPVTAVEEALAEQDRSNALNTEWLNDLSLLATWGDENLIEYLLDKGIADGLAIARSAVADRQTAAQLNASILAGTTSTGVGGADTAQILQIVAKLASGSASSPYGLRDVAADLNVADYVPVNLFNEMQAQLAKIPTALTQRYYSDIANYRNGTFYASTGGRVPGDRGTPNVDSVHAMLVPGEGVLTRRAMALIGGEKGLNSLNHNGVMPQRFAVGGIVQMPGLSSSVSTGAFSSNAMRANSSRRNNSMPPVVNINTEINNPTGESSAYSQNKMLQKNAALGTVAKIVSG